jgi:hypothetical protein
MQGSGWTIAGQNGIAHCIAPKSQKPPEQRNKNAARTGGIKKEV